MSNFQCEKCGKNIIDSPKGYITGCEHYPLTPDKSAWSKTYRANLNDGSGLGPNHDWARYAADRYCERFKK